jgi:hypothetical protein
VNSMPKRSKLGKRSPQLPILPFLYGDPGGPAAKKLNRRHLDDALKVLAGDLMRRMQTCDEDEGLAAAELDVLIRRTRHAIERGDASAAALWALKLGVTIQLFEYRFNYGGTLKRGKKFDEGLLHAAESKVNSYEPRNIRMAKEFQARLPSWDKSKTTLMQIIGKKERRPLKRSASVNAINKGLKIVVQSKAEPDK